MFARLQTAMCLSLFVVTGILFMFLFEFVRESVSYDKYSTEESEIEQYFQVSNAVLLSVKTTTAYHESRLSLLLKTWLQTVDSNQVRIVTDSYTDEWIQKAEDQGFTVVHTNCPTEHEMKSLCCKSGEEFNQFYIAMEKRNGYRWFCHFDDDTYVHIYNLLRTLQYYDPLYQDLYLGHWPASKHGKRRMKTARLSEYKHRKRNSFYYATGAAYCISAALMQTLEVYFRSSNFVDTCLKLDATDDIALGAIIEGVLGHDLTEVPTMLSQGEDLFHLSLPRLRQLVTVGYKLKPTRNHVIAPGSPFTEQEDPTGFLSYHCFIYPSTPWCNSTTV